MIRAPSYNGEDKEVNHDWCNPLFTDFYQLTMAYAEWKGQRQDDDAVFEMFFRKCPFGGKYAIFAGHDEVYKFLESYKFTEEHINFVK